MGGSAGQRYRVEIGADRIAVVLPEDGETAPSEDGLTVQAAPLTETVARASAGALEHLPVARVGNLVFDASVKTQLERMKDSLIKG